MKKRIANLTSNVLSPFLIALALILLVSFETTICVADAIKWSLVATALNILPVFLFAVYLVRHNRLDSIFAGVRKQRTVIYVLAVVFASVSCITLLVLKAPSMLLALCVVGLSGIAVFTCINLWWKISLHTAFVTAGITLLFILYGSISTVSILLIPLVAWSRIELKHHSLAQAVTGALLGTSIIVVVFHLFDLI